MTAWGWHGVIFDFVNCDMKKLNELKKENWFEFLTVLTYKRKRDAILNAPNNTQGNDSESPRD